LCLHAVVHACCCACMRLYMHAVVNACCYARMLLCMHAVVYACCCACMLLCIHAVFWCMCRLRHPRERISGSRRLRSPIGLDACSASSCARRWVTLALGSARPTCPALRCPAARLLDCSTARLLGCSAALCSVLCALRILSRVWQRSPSGGRPVL